MSVVSSIFVSETLRVAQSDDRVMLMQNQRDAKFHVQKMKNLFDATDVDGSGEIDKEEFKDMLENSEVVSWLTAMQLTCNDPEKLTLTSDY